MQAKGKEKEVDDAMPVGREFCREARALMKQEKKVNITQSQKLGV